MDSPRLSWEDAQTFLAVIEHKSFSAAAKALGVGQPTISRRIQDLENSLKQQLFIRGKHGAESTTAALHLKPAAENMAKWAVEFDRFAIEQLAPFAAMLKLKEPGIRLEILSSIEHVDLTRGVADIAIRSQYPNEPELECLHEGNIDMGVYAAKSYVKKIKQPCAWKNLDWVSWSDQYKNLFPHPMLAKVIPDFMPVFTSDDYMVQKAAVAAGLGAMILSKPMGFEKSKLVEIDVGVTLPNASVYVVCAKSMRQVPKIKLVVDQLASVFLTE